MNEALLTTSEVAELLRLSQETVRRLLLSGELRGVQIGRSYRIPRSAIESLLSQRPAKGTADENSRD